MNGRLLKLGELLIAFALPLFDFLFIVYLVYITTTPDLLSPFVAIVVGCLAATFAIVVFIAAQGSTIIEINIGALILFVLLGIAYPSARDMPKVRRANLQKREIQQKVKRAVLRLPRSKPSRSPPPSR